jgi:ABC-type transporter Mla MlaB component
MRLTGELTLANAHEVWERVDGDIVGVSQIDVTAVTKVDSAGLALITALRRKAGPQCKIVGFTPDLKVLAAAYDVEALF